MDFVAVVDQVIALLHQRGRVAYRTLKRQFQLDDQALEDLKIELIDSQRLAMDEQGTVLVWTGAGGVLPAVPAGLSGAAGVQPPLAYTPAYLAEKILTSRPALEGEEIRTRDPLVDVILTESAIFLTAEMAGVAREGIRVRLDEGKLVLQGDGDRSYFSIVDLPLDADRDTLKYTYTNGVLDVVIARRRGFN